MVVMGEELMLPQEVEAENLILPDDSTSSEEEESKGNWNVV